MKLKYTPVLARMRSPSASICVSASFWASPQLLLFKEFKSKFSSSPRYSRNTPGNPIDMYTSHNWFAFSPSNHQPQPQPDLFEALSSGPPHGGMEMTEEERRGTAELAALAAVGPKLGDLLGGCGEPMGRFSGHEIYDSELKNVAAGFLRGPPEAAEQKDLEVATEESRKAVDTFGQRTSIYRGVTRLKR